MSLCHATALDLLDNGMQPIIITDAVGSRDLYDRKIAIRRMRRSRWSRHHHRSGVIWAMS